ncbi:MAG: pitrilysin family protein [Alphaproteobacteria bacterium]
MSAAGGTARLTSLDNGMRVITDAMDTVESASLGIWVDVGTRNERPEINGVAHLLEHMAFKGTKRRSALAIAEEIEAVGGHLNAYTGRENTAYYAKVLKEDTALALDVLADILQHSVLDPDELARERAVVLQEIGQAHDTPDDIIFDHFQATAFPDQALGRPVLGSAEIVGGLPRGTLADYMTSHYGGPRMVLAAAGNIDHQAVVDQAASAFTALPVVDGAATEPARYEGGEYREKRDLEQLHLVMGFAGVGFHEPDFYVESVLSTLLGGGMSSRLFQEVREKRGLVYSIYSFTSFYQVVGLFGIYAGTGGGEAAELVPVLCDEITKVTADATEDEVVRARAQLKASLLMGLESTSARCEQLGQQMLIFGRQVPVREVVDAVDAVDAAAVRRTAGRLLQHPPTLAALGPIHGLESYDRIVRRLG